jgi:hypothetical protein
MKRLAVMGAIVLALGTPAQAQIAPGRNEAFVDVFALSAKPTGDAGDRENSLAWRTQYSRFVTDRLSMGPLFTTFKDPGRDATGNVGGLVAYHLGGLDAHAIPFVEFNATHSFGDPLDNFFDLQILAGLKFPLGGRGGRIRIAPYYYRAFYDESKTGFDAFQSWGINWGVGLLF